MSCQVTTLNVNGESLKGVLLSDEGNRHCKLTLHDDNWTSLFCLYQLLIFGAEAAPSPRPIIYVGFCEEGLPYSSAQARTVGVASNSASAWAYASETWQGAHSGRTKIDAVITDSTSNVSFFSRGNNATATQPMALAITKGSPNWTFDKVSYNPLNLSLYPGRTKEYYKILAMSRLLSGYATHINGLFSPGQCGVTPQALAAPAVTPDCLDLYWNMPSNYQAFIGGLIVTRGT